VPVGDLLDPRRFLQLAARRPVGLDIDRLLDAARLDVGKILRVCDEIIESIWVV